MKVRGGKSKPYMASGFSLLEAVMAVGLLAISISIALSLSLAVKENRAVQNMVIAGRVASRQIEEVRATSWSSIVNGTTVVSDPALFALTNASGSTVISNYLSTSSIKQINVTIQWKEPGGAKTYQLNSIVANGGTNP